MRPKHSELQTADENALIAQVENICRFHRVRGMPGLRDAMDYLCEVFTACPGIGWSIRNYPVDSDHGIATWQVTRDWNLKYGKADLIVPGGKIVPLVSDQETHFGVYSYSGSADDLRIPVRYGNGMENNCSEAGRTVLFTDSGYRQSIYDAIYRDHYRGIIMSPPVDTGVCDHILKDARVWQRMPHTGSENFSDAGTLPFGLSLTPEQGCTLREICTGSDSELPELAITLDTVFSDGTVPVLEVRIPGENPTGNWLMMTAHLCHPAPSANDNASGVAVAVEAVKNLAKIPGRKLNVILLIVPENLGTLAWLMNPTLPLNRICAGINLDMVGADPTHSKAEIYVASHPFLYHSPLPDILADNLKNAIEELNLKRPDTPFKLKRSPFAIGSDNQITCFPDFGIPSVSVGCWPDRFYHTDADTPARLSPELLKAMTDVIVQTVTKLPTDTREYGWMDLSHFHGLDRSPSYVPVRCYRGPISRTAIFERSGGTEISPLDRCVITSDFTPLKPLAMAEMLIDGRRSVRDILNILGHHGFELSETMFTDLLEIQQKWGFVSFLDLG